MKRLLLLLMPSVVTTGCTLFSDPGGDSKPAVNPHGMIVGVVRDTAGRGVSNVKVCAVAVLIIRGSPLMLSSVATTTARGAYEIPIDIDLHADTNSRAGLTVAATPPLASGLAPGMRSGLTLLIAATPPPAETTHADVEVEKGTPYDGVFCIYGP